MATDPNGATEGLLRGQNDDGLVGMKDESLPPPPPLDSSPSTTTTGGGGGPAPLSVQYNQRSPAVKRLLREAAEMARNDEPHILHASPLEDNLFEWHFTFRGPPDTVYSQGIYHGRVIFPSQYPLSPPEIVMLTPNGRFETGTKICLSISNYHPETWLPSWSIRTAITALRSFMCSDSPGSIGSMDCNEQFRTQFAKNSLKYECPCCGKTAGLLKPIPSETKGSELPGIGSASASASGSANTTAALNSELAKTMKPSSISSSSPPSDNVSQSNSNTTVPAATQYVNNDNGYNGSGTTTAIVAVLILIVGLLLRRLYGLYA